MPTWFHHRGDTSFCLPQSACTQLPTQASKSGGSHKHKIKKSIICCAIYGIIKHFFVLHPAKCSHFHGNVQQPALVNPALNSSGLTQWKEPFHFTIIFIPLSQCSGFAEKAKRSPVETSSTQAVNYSPGSLSQEPVKSQIKYFIMQNSLKHTMLKKGRVIHDICGNNLPEKVATTISEYKKTSQQQKSFCWKRWTRQSTIIRQ